MGDQQLVVTSHYHVKYRLTRSLVTIAGGSYTELKPLTTQYKVAANTVADAAGITAADAAANIAADTAGTSGNTAVNLAGNTTVEVAVAIQIQQQTQQLQQGQTTPFDHKQIQCR